MFFHRAVLALLLLLLLPHAINGQKTKPDDKEFKLGEIKGESCHDPLEIKCAEGTCTIYCFWLEICDERTPWPYIPRDARLVPTAVAFLTVDEDGKIAEDRYVNQHTAKWFRQRIGQQIYQIPFDLKFKGNKEEAAAKIRAVTDVILYFGSDFADSYDTPNYGYDPANLQLNNNPTNKLENLYTDGGVINLHWLYSQPNRLIHIPTAEEDDGKYLRISSPGIYRMNVANRRTTPIYYDPLREGTTHLT